MPKASGGPPPEPPPEVRPAVCGYFWGKTIKGSCARCGHTYREHLDLIGGGRD